MKKGFALVFLLIVLCNFALAAESTQTFQNNVDNAITTQVSVPANLQIPARILFGFNSSLEISLQNLTVLVILFIIVLLIVHELAVLISSRNGFIAWALALVITCLVSSSGGLLGATAFITSNIATQGVISLASSILVLIIIAFIILYLLKKIDQENDTLRNEMAGLKVGISSKSKIFKD